MKKGVVERWLKRFFASPRPYFKLCECWGSLWKLWLQPEHLGALNFTCHQLAVKCKSSVHL